MHPVLIRCDSLPNPNPNPNPNPTPVHHVRLRDLIQASGGGDVKGVKKIKGNPSATSIAPCPLTLARLSQTLTSTQVSWTLTRALTGTLGTVESAMAIAQVRSNIVACVEHLMELEAYVALTITTTTTTLMCRVLDRVCGQECDQIGYWLRLG